MKEKEEIIENEENLKKFKKIRTIAGVSFLTPGFLFMGLGVILVIAHYINFEIFFNKILFLSLGIMIVGALIRDFFDTIKILTEFSVFFVVITAMISMLLPIFLSMFSKNNTIQFIIEMIFEIIYWTILGACLITLVIICFKDAETSTIEDTIPIN